MLLVKSVGGTEYSQLSGKSLPNCGSRQIGLVIVIGAAVFHIVPNVAESSCLNITHREGAEVREHDAQIGQTCPTAFLIKSYHTHLIPRHQRAMHLCCPVAHTYHHRRNLASEEYQSH